MPVASGHAYVVGEEGVCGGEPVIRGTRTPVRGIAELWKFGCPPEEIVEHLPHLTLAQVFDALSYYYDHQAQIDGAIEENRSSTPSAGSVPGSRA